MAYREHYSAQVLTESTVTSTSWSSACPLTFTPATSGSFLVLWNSELVNKTAVTSDAKLRVTAGGVALAEMNAEFRSLANEYGGYSGFFRITATAGVSVSLDIEVCAETSGNAIAFRNRRLTVLKLWPNDAYAENFPTVAVSTGTSGWDDLCTLTFTPASSGEYLLLGHSQSTNYATTPPCYLRLYCNGVGELDQRIATNGHGEVVGPPPNRIPIYKQWVRSLTGGEVCEIKTQGHSHNTGSTIWFDESRIVALRLDDFTNFLNVDLATLQTISSSSPVSAMSVTGTVAANDHLILGCGWTTSTSNINDLADIQLNDSGTVISNPVVKPYSVTSSRGQQFGFAGLTNYSTAGSRTYSLDVATAGTSVIRPGSAITVLDLGSSGTDVTVTAAGRANLSITGYGGSVTGQTNASVSAASRQTISITGYAGSVIGQRNATVTAAARQTISINGYQGAVQAGATITASSRQTLALNGYAGSVTTQKNATVTATGRQTLSITGNAGSAVGQQNTTVQGQRGQLTITGFEGSVATSGSTTVTATGRQTLVITGHEGAVAAQQNTTVTAAGRQTLSLTGFVGSVSAVRNTTVEALDRQTLILTGYPGSVQTSGSTTVQAGPRQTLIMTGFAGSVSASSTVVASGFQLLNLTGFVGDISASSEVKAVSRQTLSVTGYQGSVGSFGNIPNRKARTVSISRSSRTVKLRTVRRIVRLKPTG